MFVCAKYVTLQAKKKELLEDYKIHAFTLFLSAFRAALLLNIYDSIYFMYFIFSFTEGLCIYYLYSLFVYLFQILYFVMLLF